MGICPRTPARPCGGGIVTFARRYLAAGIQQLAFVVEDIARGERFFSEKLGVSRFCRFEDIHVDEAVYRGSPGAFHYHLSLGYAGDVAIELIQHLSGNSIYKEFLDAKGEGTHHLGFLVPDHDAAVRDFGENGYPVVQGGRIGGSRFAYFDTRRDCGLYMETLMLDREGMELFERIKRGDF
jgi:catechol 2,3-dioxygenase-like lactoylglutathione lyase family enzyme